MYVKCLTQYMDHRNHFPNNMALVLTVIFLMCCYIIVVVVQLLSRVRLCDPMAAACQASLSFTISQSFLKFMSIDLVMPSNHLILCCPFLLLPSIFPSIRVFSNESALHIRWSK